MNQYQDNLDGYIITGDISDTGRKVDLFHAKGYLFPNESANRIPKTSPYKSLYPINLNNKPVILLPGNHDRYEFPFLNPGSRNFDTVFSEQWGDNDEGITYHLLPNRRTPKFIIVCADLTLKNWRDTPEAYLYMGQGMVYEERLDKLTEISESKSKEYGEIPVIWAMHFAPEANANSGKSIPNKIRLLGSRKLLKAAKQSRINYIFCGHFHECIDYSIDSEEEIKTYCSGSPIFPESNACASLQVIRIILDNNRINKIDIVPLKYNGLIFDK